jgi:hypothetical protein
MNKRTPKIIDAFQETDGEHALLLMPNETILYVVRDASGRILRTLAKANNGFEGHKSDEWISEEEIATRFEIAKSLGANVTDDQAHVYEVSEAELSI